MLVRAGAAGCSVLPLFLQQARETRSQASAEAQESARRAAYEALQDEAKAERITIVPRGRAGGYVMPLPEDRFVVSREYFMDRIAMALGRNDFHQTIGHGRPPC